MVEACVYLIENLVADGFSTFCFILLSVAVV